MQAIGGRALTAGLLAGLASAFVLLAIELLTGNLHVGETLVGVMIGTLFFAITGIATWRFQNSEHLQTIVLGSYIVKVIPLVLVAAFVDFNGVNRAVAGISVLAGALAYVGGQTLVVARQGDASPQGDDRRS